MRANNFNERLNDLHETLRILHKKSLQNNGLSGIDQEVIKFKIVQFYEEFLMKEDLAPIETATKIVLNESPIRETESLTDSLIQQSVDIEAPMRQASEMILDEELQVQSEGRNMNTVEPLPLEVPLQKLDKNSLSPEPSLSFAETLIEDSRTEQLTKKVAEVHTTIPSPAKGLNDRFSHIKANNSVNERFKSDGSENLSNRFHASTTSMSELLDLNKKLLFVTQVFGGNHELFQQVLKQLDTFSSSNEAILFMEHNKPKLNLTEKQEEYYLSFIEIIKKKF